MAEVSSPLALSMADLFGDGFAGILELLFVGLELAAGFVAGEHVVNELPVIATPVFEAFLDGGGVFADDADIEHGAATLAGDGGWDATRIFPECKGTKKCRNHSIGVSSTLRKWISAPSLCRQMAPWVAVRPVPSFMSVPFTQTLT
jgi:hypothetical protein